MGRSRQPSSLELVLENQKESTKLFENIVKTISDLQDELNNLRSIYDRRLKAIEKKVAKSEVLPEREQGPDEWREIMKSACSQSRGENSVSIPWDRINDAKKFKEWFKNDVRRHIVDGKVGNKYPPKDTSAMIPKAMLYADHPTHIDDFN